MNHPERFPDDLLRAVGSQRGPCPSAEELLEYAEGRFADAGAIESHVSVCGLCDLIVLRLRKADDPAETAPLDSERRVAAALGLPPLAAEVRTKGTAKLWRLLASPAFAYAFGAVLAVTGYLLPRPPHAGPASPAPAPQGITPLAAARRVELDVTRAAQTVHLTHGNGPIILSFVLPNRPGVRYTASLLDANGQPGGTCAVAPSEDGFFYVVFAAGQLRAGAWRLQVSETDPPGGRPFVFHFNLD